MRLDKLCEQLSQLQAQQLKFADINLALTKQVERLTEKIEERERIKSYLKDWRTLEEKKKRKGIAILRPLTNIKWKKIMHFCERTECRFSRFLFAQEGWLLYNVYNRQ